MPTVYVTRVCNIKTIEKRNTNRAIFIALFVLVLSITLVVFWSLKTHKNEAIDNDVKRLKSSVNETKVIKAVPELTKHGSEQIEPGKTAYSTPTQHDQLVISPSLEGTNIDGALQADQNNQLILSLQIRDFFDYFLSTADEIGLDQSIAEIQRYANDYLPEPAKSQANELLEKYLHFKQVEYDLQQVPISQEYLNDKGALSLMRENFESLKLNRKTLFSPAQDQALFALEDTFSEHTLATLELMADETLSNEQISHGLQLLEEKLPPELSNSFAQTRADKQHTERITELVDSSLDNGQLHSRLIEEGLTVDKVNEIIERREQQVIFDSNYSKYQESVSALDPKNSEFENQKQALIQRYFLTPEQQTQAKLRDLNYD